MKNFLRLDGRSILSVPYMYIDHKDYLADSLLTQNHVSVRFGSEFSRDNSSYRIIICKVRKKDTAEFEKSMELLCNKMLLFGHNDYMESTITSWKHWDRIEVPHEEIICSDQQTE